MFRTVVRAALVALALGPVAGAQDGEEPIAASRHTVVVGGATLRYTARAGRLALRHNETGEARGQVFFVSYHLDAPSSRTPRPLTFVWNGGPGSNAALVHLVGFGPKRLVPPANAAPDARWALEVNPDTWLAGTDLVFVDPIGTGYSRATRAEFARDFYSDRGDAESIAEFIRVYRTRFDAHDAPLFLAGESYGVTRAAGVAAVLQSRGIAVRGTILIGLALPLATLSDAQRQAFSLPTLTVAAFAHRKLPAPLGTDLESSLREAERFAAGPYLRALEQGSALGDAERDNLARELARFTGLDASRIDRRALNPTRMQVGNELLRREARFVGQYDSRMTGPLDTLQVMYDPTRDPSLASLLDPIAVLRYLRNELGFRSDLQYQGPFGGGYPGATSFRGDWMSLKWDWARGTARDSLRPPWPPGVPRLAIDTPLPLRTAMERDSALRVLSACGIYDLVCDYYGNEWTAGQLPGALQERVTVKRYGGGHALYTDPGVHAAFSRDVLSWMRAAQERPK